jgi:hypothetical protein
MPRRAFTYAGHVGAVADRLRAGLGEDLVLLGRAHRGEQPFGSVRRSSAFSGAGIPTQSHFGCRLKPAFQRYQRPARMMQREHVAPTTMRL